MMCPVYANPIANHLSVVLNCHYRKALIKSKVTNMKLLHVSRKFMKQFTGSYWKFLTCNHASSSCVCVCSVKLWAMKTQCFEGEHQKQRPALFLRSWPGSHLRQVATCCPNREHPFLLRHMATYSSQQKVGTPPPCLTTCTHTIFMLRLSSWHKGPSTGKHQSPKRQCKSSHF